MKKILVFGITDNPGGVESVIMSYYRQIDRSKYQFDFLCNTNVVAHENEILKLGGKIYRICARSINHKKYESDMNSFFSNHANEYCAIWVNVCSLANIDYLKYAKKYGIKRRIIHSHNSHNMDSFVRGILHSINKLLINKYATDFWACSYDAALWFYPKNIAYNAIIIHNAINIQPMMFDLDKRNEIRKKYNLLDNFVIGNVGRLHFQKNQEFIIDIFDEFYKINKKARLVLVGQGEDEHKLKVKVENMGLNDVVVFAGVQKDIQGWLSSFDFFLFPSLFEGLSIAALEAQANGLPMLCSESVNPQELKINSNFEFFSLKSDAIEWAHELSQIASEGRVNKNEISTNFQKNGYDITLECVRFERILENL